MDAKEIKPLSKAIARPWLWVEDALHNQEASVIKISSLLTLFGHLLNYLTFWAYLKCDKQLAMLLSVDSLLTNPCDHLFIIKKDLETWVSAIKCKLNPTIKKILKVVAHTLKQMCCRISGFNSTYLLRAWKPPARCLKVSWGAVLNE